MGSTDGPLEHIQIPVIDISGPDSQSDIAARLVEAATVHGFVYIKNLGHDIPVGKIDQTFDLAKNFFASPIEEKEKCVIKEDNHGWSAMHSETLDSKTQRIGDFKEAFNIGEFSPTGTAQQQMPPSLTSQESEISHFFDICHLLCIKLLTLFGVGLHIDPSHGGPTWFSARHARSLGPSGCTLRLLYYPSLPPDADYQPDIDIRAGAHSDYGSITLLFQRPSQPGLEILTPSGSWSPVPVLPPGTEQDPSPPILVNIGDLFSYWTNGLLKSTVHRVIFPKEARKGGEDRYSIAFFCHPADTTALEPVPSEMVRVRAAPAENGHAAGAEPKVMTAKEHLHERLRATYLSLYSDKGAQDKVVEKPAS